MSNEKKNSVLEFIEENYPTEIRTDYEKGCAYACDEIEKLLDEDDATDKIVEFIEDNTLDLVAFGSDFENGCTDLLEGIEKLLYREESSIMIKHMKAPKECNECLFCREKSNSDYGSHGHCLLLNDKPVNLLSHDKLNDCPIVEIEHPDD